jgi:hypothetical protein
MSVRHPRRAPDATFAQVAGKLCAFVSPASGTGSGASRFIDQSTRTPVAHAGGDTAMHSLIYIVGLIVVIVFVLSLLGLA